MAFQIDFSDQVAIITGAAGGIGSCCAYYLAKAGAQVVAADYKDPEDAEKALSAISKIGKSPLYIQCDLIEPDSRKNIVQQTLEAFGRVDILINCAAMPIPDWELAFSANVVAPLDLIDEVAKDMEKRSYGRIVNITSSSFVSGGGAIPQYNATKGALDSLTRYLARQYAPKGILINSVAPGPVLTEMIQMRYSKEEFSDHYKPQMPIDRYLVPEDIAGTVMFLSSELCSGMCGQMLLCDGGRVTLGVK